MSESKFQSNTIKAMKAKGWYPVKIGLCNRNGFPDSFFMRDVNKSPNIIFVEFKDTGKKPEPLQLFIHKELKNMGYPVYVCGPDTNNKDEILNL